MARIGDVANIIGGELPDISTASALDETTATVWQAIQKGFLTKSSPAQTYDGAPGRIWYGSMHSVVCSIWPRMRDLHSNVDIKERDELQTISTMINRHMRNANNAICVRKGNGKMSSSWWISDYFTPTSTKYKEMAEKVGKRFNGPDVLFMPPALTTKQAESISMVEKASEVRDQGTTNQDGSIDVKVIVNDDSKPQRATAKGNTVAPPPEAPTRKRNEQRQRLECRNPNCDAIMQFERIRKAHERNAHNEVYDEKGNLIASEQNDGKVTDDQVDYLVREVIAGADHELSHNAVTSMVRGIAPLVSRMDITNSVNRHLGSQDSDVVAHPRSNNYALYLTLKSKLPTGMSSVPMKTAVAELPPVKQATPTTTTATTKKSTTTTHKMKVTLAKVPVTPAIPTTMGEARLMVEAVLGALDNLQKLENQLTNDEESRDGLLARLTALATENDQLRTQLEMTQAMLKAVTAERNDLNRSLEQMRDTVLKQLHS